MLNSNQSNKSSYLGIYFNLWWYQSTVLSGQPPLLQIKKPRSCRHYAWRLSCVLAEDAVAILVYLWNLCSHSVG